MDVASYKSGPSAGTLYCGSITTFFPHSPCGLKSRQAHFRWKVATLSEEWKSTLLSSVDVSNTSRIWQASVCNTLIVLLSPHGAQHAKRLLSAVTLNLQSYFPTSCNNSQMKAQIFETEPNILQQPLGIKSRIWEQVFQKLSTFFKTSLWKVN